MIKITLAPTAELANSINAHVSVEAEYGSTVKRGSVLTLAHHQREGEFSTAGGAPSPCNAGALIAGALPALRAALDSDGEVRVVVSHLDLDTIGGCLRVAAALTELAGDRGIFEGRESFWALAEFVDLNGPHKLGVSGASEEDLRALRAYWAAVKGEARLPRDAVSDVTDVVLRSAELLRGIFAGDEQMLAAGDKLLADEEALNSASFVEERGGVVVRAHSGFTNHLYVAPGSATAAKAVVAFSTTSGAVTVSLADPFDGVSCRDIVQALWGPEAGGHAGIAGSPRGQRLSLDDLVKARDALVAALASAS